MKILSSLGYFLEGILIGFIFLSIPGNGVGNFTLLHITDRLLSFSCSKFNGLFFPSKSKVIDWCCLSTFRSIITSFTKLFSSVNSALLHKNFSFPRITSARASPITFEWRSLSANANFPSKTLLILNPSRHASLVVIKQSLAPVSNNPLKCTPFISILINEGLRTLALHSTELEFFNAVSKESSEVCFVIL